MGFVHSLVDTPPKRHDSVAWAQVRIEESSDDVTFAAVETQALVADPDPADPAERSLTTDDATLVQGWFRLVWIDPEGDESPPSSSVFSPSEAEEFRTRLERKLANTDEPILSDDEITELLLNARRQDIYGLYPTDDGWTETYDLDAAAAEGWRRKASRVYGDFAVELGDGIAFSRHQVYAHCMAMSRAYSGRTMSFISTAPPPRT